MTSGNKISELPTKSFGCLISKVLCSLPWCSSEPDFHIWNANSQSFGRAKVKPRWPPMQGKFLRLFQSSSWSCTSVPVLHTTSIFSFCLVRCFRKHSQPWKKCSGSFTIRKKSTLYVVVCWFNYSLCCPAGYINIL